jgi:hypothetical protein
MPTPTPISCEVSTHRSTGINVSRLKPRSIKDIDKDIRSISIPVSAVEAVSISGMSAYSTNAHKQWNRTGSGQQGTPMWTGTGALGSEEETRRRSTGTTIRQRHSGRTKQIQNHNHNHKNKHEYKSKLKHKHKHTAAKAVTGQVKSRNPTRPSERIQLDQVKGYNSTK